MIEFENALYAFQTKLFQIEFKFQIVNFKLLYYPLSIPINQPLLCG